MLREEYKFVDKFIKRLKENDKRSGLLPDGRFSSLQHGIHKRSSNQDNDVSDTTSHNVSRIKLRR